MRLIPTRWEIDRENQQTVGEDDFDGWLAKFQPKPTKTGNGTVGAAREPPLKGQYSRESPIDMSRILKTVRRTLPRMRLEARGLILVLATLTFTPGRLRRGYPAPTLPIIERRRPN